MNRAMFSGVAGMKAHQARMDVIGNNIANVNTYGYKSQRAVFSDIYYQTLHAASGGTANRGGQNPSMIGYGSTLAGVQSQMTQSSMQNTGFGLDVAITGEGFLQVMDPDGNIFYTKAGMLNYDSEGYLTDINGNFVLGSSNAEGKPGIQKIKLDNIGAVVPKRSTVTEAINGVQYTVTASNATKQGNLSVNFSSSETLPVGKKAAATLSGASVNVQLNSTEKFNSLDELNAAVNQAIIDANGGRALPAGTFTISANPIPSFAGGLTGKQIVGTNFGYDKGSIDIGKDNLFGGFTVDSVGNKFNESGDATFTLTRITDKKGPGVNDQFNITAKVGGKVYTGTVHQSQMDMPGKMILSNSGSSTDIITMTYPAYSSVISGGNKFEWKDKGAAVQLEIPDKNTIPQNAFGGFTFSATTLAGGMGGKNWNMSVEPKKDGEFTVSIKHNGDTFTGVYSRDVAGGVLQLTNGKDSITVNAPSYDKFLASATGITYDNGGKKYEAKASVPSKDLGFSSANFKLADGTEGGPVTLDKLTSISIGADGSVTVSNPEKGNVIAGRISLANFANPQGLAQKGNDYFAATANSGDPRLADPGSDGTGALKSSALEMSNVDLSEEFANMITTQRGFQANSRVITVSDTMLEELINLKR